MDRIELAERRFKQILPEPVLNRHEMNTRELGVWLRDDVVPLVAEYVARPKFQDAACWSLRAFRPGADTDARRQVNTVADALTRHARLLRAALRSRRVAAAIPTSAPPQPLVYEEVMVTGSGVEQLNYKVEEVERLPILTAQVNAIAKPFWSDLVDRTDYLEPRRGWLFREPGDRARAGEFIVWLNPELHAIGDFVTRCLFRRVQVLTEILEEADRLVLSCIRTLRGKSPKVLAQLTDDVRQLREEIRILHVVCRPDTEAAIRDSCVILTQVFAAFHPAATVDWLGLDEEVVECGRAMLWHRFERAQNLEFTERVAAALGDLKRLYANEPPGRSALEEAVVRGGLVLATNPRCVYWSGIPLAVDWDKFDRPWELLLKLARRVKTGLDVEEKHLFADRLSLSAMATLCLRLKKLLPVSLKKLIRSGSTARSYRLDCERSTTFIID